MLQEHSSVNVHHTIQNQSSISSQTLPPSRHLLASPRLPGESQSRALPFKKI